MSTFGFLDPNSKRAVIDRIKYLMALQVQEMREIEYVTFNSGKPGTPIAITFGPGNDLFFIAWFRRKPQWGNLPDCYIALGAHGLDDNGRPFGYAEHVMGIPAEVCTTANMFQSQEVEDAIYDLVDLGVADMEAKGVDFRNLVHFTMIS
jgi:hypothetical protein